MHSCFLCKFVLVCLYSNACSTSADPEQWLNAYLLLCKFVIFCLYSNACSTSADPEKWLNAYLLLCKFVLVCLHSNACSTSADPEGGGGRVAEPLEKSQSYGVP